MDKLASFYFNKIKLEHECEHNFQISNTVLNFESMLTLVSSPNFDPIPEQTLIPLPINLEYEPLVLDSHILFLGKECESQFLDLDSTFEPT